MLDDCIQRGRPYGGLAILWNKKMHVSVQHIDLDNKNMDAIVISLCGKNIVLVNVYFPTNCTENDVCISEYIGDLCSLWNKDNDSELIICGDINLDPKIEKYVELNTACNDNDLCILDVSCL